MTYRHSFDSSPPASGPPGEAADGGGERSPWKIAVDRLRSAVDRGLGFYWTLVSAASEVAGGARSRLRIEASGRPEHARSPAEDPAPGADPRQRASPRRHLFPGMSATLVIDGDSAPIDSDLAAFTSAAEALLPRERWQRELRYHLSACRAIESRAAHQLRTLLQPLLLHVDQIRRAESATPKQLQLLDDLTRALVEWVEEDLDGERLADELRIPSPRRSGGTDLRLALEEALDTDAERVLPASFPERLPALAVDRPVLVAGLEELLRFGPDGTESLGVDRTDDASVRLRVELGAAPPVETSRSPGSEESAHPPVVGGVLNLVGWMEGTIQLEKHSESAGVVDVHLPLASPAEEKAD